jgi:hypothetical protein
MPISPVSKDVYQLVFEKLRDKSQMASALPLLEATFSSLSKEDCFSVYFDLRAFLKQKSPENLCGQLEVFEPRLFEIFSTCETPALSVTTLRARKLVLETEYPEIKADGDADIEKYFRARAEKWLPSARAIYSRLSQKYPLPESRTSLLRWFRTKNSFFLPLLEQLKNDLADRSISAFKRTVLYILRCFGGGKTGKSWTVLEPIHEALKIFPLARSEASRYLMRLQAYSKAAAWHEQEFNSICGVLQDYLGDHLFDRKEIRLVLPKNFLRENQPQNKVKVVTYDVATVVFSAQDLKEILINPKIQGTENITLTYCWQYWLRTEDSVFENKVYLYSARHKGPQFHIFRIIKEGKKQGIEDEAILYAIYDLLSREGTYQYNVRKDIYMQNVWQRIKPGVVKPVIEDTRAWAEQLIEKDKIERRATHQRAYQAVEKQRQERDKTRRLANDAVTRMQQEEAKKRARAEAKVVALREQEKISRARAAERAKLGDSSRASTTAPPRVWTKYDGSEIDLIPIRDRVAQLQGTQTKNLHVLFKSHLVDAIEDFLRDPLEKQERKISNVQRTLIVLAIKSFFQANYEKSQRSWMMSNERMKVKELGLDIEDVEPVVEACLSRLSELVKAG